ncbi:hypothetical protein [Conchiformibius kuhniae]|uniref:Uncharacterized protein n=1 Tax=Conchiformibius kuhniae TaxID=211502 RepID=A0A8T9MSD0_9NEIS|nr:hypothetical protein [Conchiformibius kuhniae]UOP04181.1 hypothetical protein LVJ77_06945 [Conchiformibius kuhniae]
MTWKERQMRARIAALVRQHAEHDDADSAHDLSLPELARKTEAATLSADEAAYLIETVVSEALDFDEHGEPVGETLFWEAAMDFLLDKHVWQAA